MTVMESVVEYVTAAIGGQLFGLPIWRVQDVFVPDRLTRVPLAPAEIAGTDALSDRTGQLGFASLCLEGAGC